MVTLENSLLVTQQMQMQCANDILEAHLRYEKSLEQEQFVGQHDSIYDDYNALVEEYNNLLQHAKLMASALRKSNECLHQTEQKIEQQDAVIKDLSSEINKKDNEAKLMKLDFQKQQDQMRESFFVLSLVNTVLSTQSLTIKNILNEWDDKKVYQKRNFLNKMLEIRRFFDFEKNKLGNTNSTEAIAYLKLNNSAVFNKVSANYLI